MRTCKTPLFCRQNVPRTNTKPVKTQCGMTHSGCHLAHLPISAFFQSQFNPTSGNISSMSDIRNSGVNGGSIIFAFAGSVLMPSITTPLIRSLRASSIISPSTWTQYVFSILCLGFEIMAWITPLLVRTTSPSEFLSRRPAG